jgi:L-2-hydroxyglutarate oxidase
VEHDIVVVGGGIIGLATALQINTLNPRLSVALLEKENALARHQTGNNSGVIHSGLYYKPGSLKARNCVRGYQLLIEFCRKHEIPFELCGKIVVASTEGERLLLQNLFLRGQQNGLGNLRKLSANELKAYEPHVRGLEGIHVPQTGIVDYVRVAARYGELIQKAGTQIFFDEKVTDIRANAGKSVVITERSTHSARLVVSCAGLYADTIARMTMPQVNFRIIPFRGEYYKLKKEKEYLVRNLIYPVPDPNFPFLGVHFTRMAKGGVEAGPNAVLAFRREGYRKSDVQLGELAETLAWPGFRKVAAKYWRTGLGEMRRSFSKTAFTKALQNLIPEITEADLVEGGAGVRAQACDRNGGLIDDFLILEDNTSIHVCNAPSPAATSSLAIGETVADLVLKRF